MEDHLNKTIGAGFKPDRLTEKVNAMNKTTSSFPPKTKEGGLPSIT
jgi:hypothetical protein